MKMNKRGQWEQTLAIVLILVVLALAIYFVYTNFSKGSSTIANLQQSQLSAAAQACSVNSITSPSDFCGRLYDIGGGAYATCDAAALKSSVTNSFACSSTNYASILSTQCAGLKYPATLWVGSKIAGAKVQNADACVTQIGGTTPVCPTSPLNCGTAADAGKTSLNTACSDTSKQIGPNSVPCVDSQGKTQQVYCCRP